MALLHFTVYYLLQILSFHTVRGRCLVLTLFSNNRNAQGYLLCVHISFSLESTVKMTFYSKGFLLCNNACNITKLLALFLCGKHLAKSFEFVVRMGYHSMRKKVPQSDGVSLSMQNAFGNKTKNMKYENTINPIVNFMGAINCLPLLR